MGIEIAGVGLIWWGLGAAVAVGSSVGTSSAQAHQQAKKQKTLAEAQEAQVQRAEKKAADAKSLAQQEATETLKKQRLAQTQTILTSPLGISEEAPVAKTTLG